MTDHVQRDDDDAVRDYLDLAALFAETIPLLGGAVSNVLGGWSQQRRFQRIREVLGQLQADLTTVRDRVREDYIRSDEFEDLLDQTLRRVANERHEAKRRLYAAFLADAVTSPGEPYHEQLRFLRTLEELQPDHVRIIRALLKQPPPAPPGTGGISTKGLTSINSVLRERLADIPPERLTELVVELTDDLRIVAVDHDLTTLQPPGMAMDLRNGFTPYGRRLVAHIRGLGGSAE